MKRLTIAAFVLVVGLAMAVTPAAADTFSFTCNSNNSGVCPTLASQLSFTVTDNGNGTVSFVFNNAGPVPSSIADIYFGYFGSNPGIIDTTVAMSITNGTGVSFSQGASPPQLPSNPAGYTDFAGFNADSNAPTSTNGINPGETLTIIVALQTGASFQDLVNSLNAGGLSIGIHVQAIGTSGDSDSLNNCTAGTCTPIPEPGTLALFGTGLLGLAGVIRRKLVG